MLAAARAPWLRAGAGGESLNSWQGYSCEDPAPITIHPMKITPSSPAWTARTEDALEAHRASVDRRRYVALNWCIVFIAALVFLVLFLTVPQAHGQTPPPTASVSVATADGPANLAPLPPDAQAALALAEKLHPGWPWGAIVQWGAVIVFASRCLLKYWPGMPAWLASVLGHTGSHIPVKAPEITKALSPTQP